ncbi:TonB-dependent receptor [Larkinella harenae]
MKRLFAVLGLLLVGFCSQGQNSYTVTGSVFDAGTNGVLAGVYVYTPGKTVGTVTDSNGLFTLTLSARDSLTLLFSYVGYQTVRRTIPFRSDQRITIALSAGQLLDELTVRPIDRPELVSRKPQMSQIRLSAEQLTKLPALLGEKDVLRVLQLLPGVQKGAEGNTGIYVRGGGPDQNLILLDGAVLYNSGHLLGFFSAFNGSAIQHVELTKGGFPARFGGRLSSVIEVSTKDGNAEKLSGEAGLGLISSRLVLQGPLGKKRVSQPATFLIAGRRTYVDLVTRPFAVSDNPDAVQTNTFFYDLNSRVSYPIGSNDKLFLSAFRSRDAFVNRSQTDNRPLQGSLNWQNTVGTLRWHHRFSDDAFVNLSLIYSQYHLNVANDGFGLRDTTRSPYALRYRSGIRDLGLNYALEFAQHDHQFRFGLQSTHHRFTPGAAVTTGDLATAPSPRFFIDALETGLYAEDTWQPGPCWHLNAGFRLSHFLLLRSGMLSTDSGGQTGSPSDGPPRPTGRPIQYLRPEPRLSIAYQIDSSFSIKASYALMNQYAHLLSNNGLGLPADLWIPTTGRIRPQQARQVAIGLAKDFVNTGNPSRSLAITLEGYYKTLGNSISYAEGTSFLSTQPATDAQLWENNITTGRGWSYGSELFVQKKAGRLSGWMGYTLSWTWWQFPALNGGRKFFPRYDRRHDASVVGIYEFKPGITFSGTWVYGTGQALTLPISRFSGYENRPPASVGSGRPSEQLFGPAPNVKEYGPRNGFRAQAYHRLDIGFQFRKKRKHVVRTWEVGVYNLYNRRNPFYYSLEGKEQGVGKHSKTVLYKYSLFPAIPSVSYTISF